MPVPGLALTEGSGYAHSLHSGNARTDIGSLPSGKVKAYAPASRGTGPAVGQARPRLRAQDQRAHLLRQLHALAGARAAASPTAVESLLITAAELHTRADLGVVGAAEKTLTTHPAAANTGPSSPAITPPQTAAG